MMTRSTIATTFAIACSLWITAHNLTAQEGTAQESDPRYAVVVNHLDSSVSAVDLNTFTVTTTWKVGPRPYFAATGSGKVAVSVEGERTVEFFEIGTWRPLGSISTPKLDTDHLISFDGGKKALLGLRDDDAIAVIDMSTMKEVARITGIDAPHNIQIGPSGRYAYVTGKINTGITIVDLKENKVKAFHPLKLRPRGLTVSADERFIYFGANWVNGFFEMDASSGKITRVFPIDPPAGAPPLAEDTYHGFELIAPDIMLCGLEGNSCIDVVHLPTGTVLDRFTDVDKPSALIRYPGRDREFIVASKGNNALLHLRLDSSNAIEVVRTTTVGTILGEISKRFTYAY